MLRPNTAGKYTEVRLTLCVPASGPPQLGLEVLSPRVLLMQRFVLDVVYAVKLFLVRAVLVSLKIGFTVRMLRTRSNNVVPEQVQLDGALSGPLSDQEVLQGVVPL